MMANMKSQGVGLGVFIKFQELGFDWASRLVHYMLGFQLYIKKKYELWSLVGPQHELTFGRCWEFMSKRGHLLEEIITAFERCEGWSRMIAIVSRTLPSSPDTLKEKVFNPTGRDISVVTLLMGLRKLSVSGCTQLFRIGATYGNPLPNNPSPPIPLTRVAKQL
ncbi:hypothetical protein Bca52824_052094 [Brassica carinata]|uniref:DUF1985 domain-containing protein n=1 Tax=Brassica carinata TaxID=52824 RepID=A0A8X7UJI8_BRACI|nr:hypothetical protein Bca52824_052094 [Brassica carinata]